MLRAFGQLFYTLCDISGRHSACSTKAVSGLEMTLLYLLPFQLCSLIQLLSLYANMTYVNPRSNSIYMCNLTFYIFLLCMYYNSQPKYRGSQGQWVSLKVSPGTGSSSGSAHQLHKITYRLCVPQVFPVWDLRVGFLPEKEQPSWRGLNCLSRISFTELKLKAS